MDKSAGFIGCGTVYIAPIVNGITGVFKDIGEASSLSLKESVERKEMISSRCATSGQVADVVLRKQPVELSLTINQVNTFNWGLLLMSEAEEESLTGASFTVNKACKAGDIVRLEPNVKTLTVQDSTGATTYVEGTDYELINSSVGLVKILGTNIVDTDVTEFQGTTGDVVRTKYNGGSTYNRKYAVMLVGRNLSTDEKGVLDIYETDLVPDAGVDFLSQDFVSGTLTGKPVINEAKGETYRFINDIVDA